MSGRSNRFESDPMARSEFVGKALRVSATHEIPDYPLDAGTLAEDPLPIRCDGQCRPVAVPHGRGIHILDVLAIAVQQGKVGSLEIPL